MGKFVDLSGKEFGRLTVLERMNNDRKNSARWLCKCVCGNKKNIRSDHLTGGLIRSCGCLHLEGNNTKHNHANHGRVSKTYQTWNSMIQRCTNSRQNNYPRYGGRGIKVCNRWLKSFENFLEDMGEPPAKNYSIDRIDNNSNYCKSNCRWATDKQQRRNTRRNVFITYGGKTQCLIDWEKELGIHRRTIKSRLDSGWSTDKALSTPVRERSTYGEA